MKRAIQKLVQDPLAMKILDGEVLHGDRVLVDAGESGLSFAVTREEKAVA
jgi:ATP-dependent Clp protease ATP-binding subunit ClpB